MRQLIAIPKFEASVPREFLSQFRLIDDSDLDENLENQNSILSFEWPANANRSDTIWELIRVRSVRSKKEMVLSRVLGEEDYLMKLTTKGPIAEWQLVPGNYVLRVFLHSEIVCQTSFLVPYSDTENRIKSLEALLDENRAPKNLRGFVLQNDTQIIDRIARHSHGDKDLQSENRLIESILEIVIRQLSPSVGPDLNDDQLMERILNSAGSILTNHFHLMEKLEAVFEMTSDRSYDDHELEALVNIFIRGTDLTKYDEFGILQVIINNAKRLRIDEIRKKNSASARFRSMEEHDRQKQGYVQEVDLRHQLPESSTTDFDEKQPRLTEKQKRLITPRLVISVFNSVEHTEKSMDIPIEDTWTIGRQSSEEHKRMGRWNEPTIDYENRKIIMAGFWHNTFSKSHMSIIPTYKHAEYMDLGRTISLFNPSESYSITLGNEITLGPRASYATPNHLYFYYRVGANEIQLDDEEKKQNLRISERDYQLDFTIRIDVFFADMKKGDYHEVLIAKHEWIDKKQATSVHKHLSRTRPPT